MEHGGIHVGSIRKFGPAERPALKSAARERSSPTTFTREPFATFLAKSPIFPQAKRLMLFGVRDALAGFVEPAGRKKWPEGVSER